VSIEPNRGAEEYEILLREQIYELRALLEEERSKSIRSSERAAAQATALTREKVRGWLAGALVVTLIAVIGVTFVYLVMLSRNFADLTMHQTVSVIPMIGTTLLTPLVGLVGAVTGFYFGGQVAAQATQATQDATISAMQMGMDAGKSAGQSTTQPQ
jgi:hypothetical protein